MSDSSFFDSSDLDDIAEYEMIMEINADNDRSQDEVEAAPVPMAIHGFPGMLGSIDCMHWEWVNCPKSWHGQYGRGANNDITVLHHSPLFDDLLADNRHPVAHMLCKRAKPFR
ncbi:putative nuclease HARBI1 [Tanacetum coccineum]